jgi:hypothetical protein
MVTIRTKFIGPTNVRGSRYKAYVDDTGPARTLTMDADHRLGSEGNHLRVARALIHKCGWFHDDTRGDTYGRWFYGGTKEGYAFVCALEGAELKAEE